MRANEFISEVSFGLGNMFKAAGKKLGGTSNLSQVAPKTTATMGGSTTPSQMASVINKGIKKPGAITSYTAKKTAEPPQQNTGTVTQQSQQPQLVKTGDMIEIPNLGQTKVVKTGGATVTFQDPTDPDTTITTDKKKLGLK